MEIDHEEWRAIPGFLCYEVSNHGRIRSFRGLKPRILKPGIIGGKYGLNQALQLNGKTVCHNVARYVALAFLPPHGRNEEMVVWHIDRNVFNNRPENLRWINWDEFDALRSQNMKNT